MVTWAALNHPWRAAVQPLSHVWLFCNPMDSSLPRSSVHGVFQARILEWVAISFSRGTSQSKDRTCISCNGRQILYHRAIREATWEELLIRELNEIMHAKGLAYTMRLYKHICIKINWPASWLPYPAHTSLPLNPASTCLLDSKSRWRTVSLIWMEAGN